MDALNEVYNLAGVRAHALIRASKLINLSPDARHDLICETMAKEPWYTDTERCPIWQTAVQLIKSIDVEENDAISRRRLAIAMLTTWTMTNAALPTAFYDDEHLDAARRLLARNWWDEFHVFVTLTERRSGWLYMDVVAADTKTVKESRKNIEAQQQLPRTSTANAKRRSNSFASDTTANKKVKRELTTSANDADVADLPVRIDDDGDLRRPGGERRDLACILDISDKIYEPSVKQSELLFQPSNNDSRYPAQVANLEARISALMKDMSDMKTVIGILEAENKKLKQDSDNHKRKWDQVKDLISKLS